MYLNSHALMRKLPGQPPMAVPDEAPPLDSAGREFWPPGWDGPGAGAGATSSSTGQEGSGAEGPELQQQRALAAASGKGPEAGPKRRMETERDLFELLRIPYREPHQRNA